MKRFLMSFALLATLGTSLPASAASFWQCLKTQPVYFDGTITDAAVATEALSILTDQVINAGLAETLASPGNFTVYAPVNDAFLAIPSDILSAITADPDGLLKAVLLYHVSNGYYDPRRAYFPRKAPTEAGQNIFFSRGGGSPRVNNANVQCQPVRTTNGTVFIIDSVLLPQFFAQ
ncbi:fasciclin domain-containing protein [Ferrimonas balearica]|uniref:fasciclin domain-containing protein n=1 Tax=Ferrimonas balearica TaxID=44012 RepID=UPI001C9A2A46|nr:fasciclin domain-containing protein [Ferrimonas balearica]MBY5992662.1 fasciclin domain-containing protein [Ferrimonas balearica]